MFSTLDPQLALIMLVAPLGLIGIWRWSLFLYKASEARRYGPVPVNDAYRPSDVTFVVPVYNEDPDIFTRALRSWIAEEPHEILLVIDHTDRRSLDVAKVEKQRTTVPIKVFVTKRSGKREALVDGLSRTTTPFVTLIDSDTIFSPGATRPLLAPFIDPTIGGTAPRQYVLEARTIVQRVYNIQLQERYDLEMPFLDVGGLTTTCISGRTAMYRMTAIADKLHELEFEYFMGSRCISGDDKCLTRIMQRDNWKVKYQDESHVWTHAAPDLRTYLKQRVRWTRNTWRSDLAALGDSRRWIWSNKNLALHTVDRFVQPFTLILGPIFFVTAILSGFVVTAFLFLGWIYATRLFKLLPHMARSPKALLILPYYIVFTYIIAVLKIYALFTVWKQGWKTRWSLDRERHNTLFRESYGTLLPWGATALVIITLSSMVNTFYGSVIAASMNDDAYRSRAIPLADIRDQASQLEARIREPYEEARYIFDVGDTPQLLAARLNVPEQAVRVDELESTAYIPIGTLRTPNNVTELASRPRANVSYIPFRRTSEDWRLMNVANENIVWLEGAGTALSIGELLGTLREAYGEDLAVEQEPGVWLLKASVAVGRDVTLYFDGTDVTWLKLYSSSDYFAWLASFDGSMLIENTKITSWDSNIGSYDEVTSEDGRSFVLAKNSGRMDIIDSELAYLGYKQYASFDRGQPFGGVYGVSWKLETGTIGKKVVTGNIIDSNFHHNQFGVYTYGSIAQVMTGNDVYANLDYGFDPHDDSMYLVIEHNRAFKNGNHGIITSKRCRYNIIANNESYENALHGIMLDQMSDHNVIYGNTLHHNTDGVVAYDSHDNYIHNNEIYDNRKSGVRINVMSARNFVYNNSIRNNPKGVYVYGYATDNHILENTIMGNDLTVHFRDARWNVFERNIEQNNGRRVRVSERSLTNYVSSSN